MLFNIILLILFNYSKVSLEDKESSPKAMLNAVNKNLSSDDGKLFLDHNTIKKLKSHNIFAMVIDKDNGDVIWKENLPKGIALKYSIVDVAKFSRSYLKDYPVFVYENKYGLIVLGFPKGSYWKLFNNYMEVSVVESLPVQLLIFIISNIFFIILIYFIANRNLLKSVNPIIDGIEALSTEEDAYVVSKGSLSEIGECINKTSEALKFKNIELKRKDLARANWIAGVSHDIRTPLSIILGYSNRLESSKNLSESERKEASIIRFQSIKMKALINDLNLASKLEYNMQPFEMKKINAVSVVRAVIVDYLNSGLTENYEISLTADEKAKEAFILGDYKLIKRAVSNLIENSINHNENGCNISISIEKLPLTCKIIVSDNGCGISEEKLNLLNNSPHYMLCDDSTKNQRHGLGTLIVKQIMEVHHGILSLSGKEGEGFIAALEIPLYKLQ